MRNRIKIIEFPVFSNFIVHVEVTEELEKAVGKYPSIADMSNETDNEQMDAITGYDGGKVCFIFIRPDGSVGTRAHEGFHGVENMMNAFGVKLEGETPAYHIGYVVDHIFKLFRKR